VASGFEALRRRGFSGDDVLATPGSSRERGRNSTDGMNAHLNEIETKRQQLDPNAPELTPAETLRFRQRRQGA
jgi:hypothetical protein